LVKDVDEHSEMELRISKGKAKKKDAFTGKRQPSGSNNRVKAKKNDAESKSEDSLTKQAGRRTGD